MPNMRLHSDILLNQVRVKTAKAGGSGTIIYSQPYQAAHKTYALTCHHVIEDAITVREDWDPALGRQRKREYRQGVTVEFFDWGAVPHAHKPLTSSVDAEIVAYDKTHDMALLELRMTRPANAVAAMYPPESITGLAVGDPVLACGCALLHDPILTQGHITHMGEEIDYKTYWMGSANIVFGNSGGSMWADYQDTYHFIGIPSRVDVINWSSPVTHLGYFSPISRVYEFFAEQLFHFLIPGNEHTIETCLAEREQRGDMEKRRLLLEGVES